jgi:hypothetical protein
MESWHGRYAGLGGRSTYGFLNAARLSIACRGAFSFLLQSAVL